jgi:hypothetical protein
MSLLFRLRAAARQAADITIEFGGSDPVELIALARQIGERENCTADCTTPPDRPHVLCVRFARCPSTTAEADRLRQP